MRRLIVVYGVVLLAGSAGLAYRPDFFGNVGFLVIGALLGIYPAFFIEEFKHRRELEQLAAAIHYELANRVARCCFDFENPWSKMLSSPQDIPVFRVRKFVPERPIIYPSAGVQIASLTAAQAIIEFYFRLAAWERDIRNSADAFDGARVPSDHVRFLANRLRETLEPGKRALDAVSESITNAEQIEREAIAESDRLFPEVHPNKDKTLRERIDLMLRETAAKMHA